MTRRSCSSRGAGRALRSTESRPRKRCWRSPKTIWEVRTVFPFVAFRTKSERLIVLSPRRSHGRRLLAGSGSGTGKFAHARGKFFEYIPVLLVDLDNAPDYPALGRKSKGE